MNTRSTILAFGALSLGFAAGARLLTGETRPHASAAAAPQPEAQKPPSPETAARRRAWGRKKIVFAAVTAAVLAAAGIAFAAWQVTGSGSGYAKAASASALTLADATAFTSADLYPGATGAVKLRVTNPNSFPIRITAVSGNGAFTSDKGAACDASTGVTFTNQSSLAHDVGASATATVTLAGAVAMSNASGNSCQGAVFTVPVSITATSNA